MKKAETEKAAWEESVATQAEKQDASVGADTGGQAEPFREDAGGRESLLEGDAEGQKEPIARPYTLRCLKDRDLFPMLKILKKIDISNCKDAFIQTASGEKTLEEIGIAVSIDIADILIRNMEKAEEEIYGLWSDLSGIPPEEIREMEFGTLPLMIMDTFSEARDTSFFKVLSRFLS